MENHLRIICFVVAASSFAVMANLSAAEPASDWQSGMGPGMMGEYGLGYGMGHGMMGWRNFRGLNLSADQKSKITQIRHEMRTKQWDVMGQMMDAQDRLEELYDADKQDAAAINRQYKVIEDLRRQMVDNSVDAHNRINSILTKEQREKSREWGESGYGPMMWGK